MGTIEITGVDLVQFAKKVYELSIPRGLGFIHFTPAPLSDDEAKSIVREDDQRYPLSMDYVNGRGCKMDVFKKDSKLFINVPWYDHTDGDLSELLKAFGIDMQKPNEHSIACDCVDCRKK